MMINKTSSPQIEDKSSNSELKELKEKIDTYENIYGNFDTPTLIIDELYKGGTIGKGRKLVTPQDFKSRHLKTNNLRNREKVKFWLTLFEDWGIIDSDGNIRYAQVAFNKAKKILKEKIGEVNAKKT